MHITQRMSRSSFASGVIPAAGFVIINMAGASLPGSICMKGVSSTPFNCEYDFLGTQAEFIADGAVFISSTMKVFTPIAPVAYVKLTAPAGTTYNII